jgi:hypothetical protein
MAAQLLLTLAPVVVVPVLLAVVILAGAVVLADMQT